VPIQQIKIHLSGTNTNDCVSTIYLGAADPANVLFDPAPAAVGVTLAADAFPHPHQGDPITLSKTKISVAIAADVLQVGVDQNIIADGMQIPSNLKLGIAGSNTTEGVHNYAKSSTAVVHVVNGQAQPLNVTLDLPDTVWHPKSPTGDVLFTEKSMSITSSINVLGGLTAVFDCKPAGALQIGGVSATSSEVPTTTTVPGGGGGGTATTVAVTGTTTPTTPVDPGSDSLPRTGASSMLLLVLAAATIDIGIMLIGGTRRRLRRG